jgi:hypothetical protein
MQVLANSAHSVADGAIDRTADIYFLHGQQGIPLCHHNQNSDGWLPVPHHRGPGMIQGQSIWHLWWKKEALGRVYPWVLQFSDVIIIPPVLHTHISFFCQQHCVILAINSIIKENISLSLYLTHHNQNSSAYSHAGM